MAFVTNKKTQAALDRVRQKHGLTNTTKDTKEKQSNKVPSRPFLYNLCFNSQTLSSSKCINFFQKIKLHYMLRTHQQAAASRR